MTKVQSFPYNHATIAEWYINDYTVADIELCCYEKKHAALAEHLYVEDYVMR